MKAARRCRSSPSHARHLSGGRRDDEAYVLSRWLRSPWCNMHYLRWQNHGRLDLPDVAERFWRLVDRREPDECWPWLGGRRAAGYGSWRRTSSHRTAYQLIVGPIPDGMEIDHLCKNPPCCNPAHMETVTRRENILRSDNFAAHRARQTHCIHGHEFTQANTYVNRKGNRECRTCHRERQYARNHP